jgi:hypothetical protein
MKTVVVATFHESAGADVARELVADAGIRAELRRVGGDVYLGSMTAAAYELRVPEHDVGVAREILATLEADLEQAAIAAAGVGPASDDERGDASLPAPEERPRKLSWAIAFGLVSPVPGFGVMYARQIALGWIVVGMSLASLLAAFNGTDARALLLVLKAVDLVLAPVFAVRFNKKLKETHAAQP